MSYSSLARWMGPVKYYRQGRAGRIAFVVIHTAEGDWTLASAKAWMSNPQNTSKASAHYALTKDGSIGAMVHEEDTAYASPPVNPNAIHIELGGFARFTRQMWLDRPEEVAACRRLVHDICARQGFPVMLLGAAALPGAVAGTSPGGVTTHRIVNDHYHKSSHTDPGIGFPMDLILASYRTVQMPHPALEQGAMGPEVLKLQGMINFWFPPANCGKPDGVFGPRTKTGVIAYQNELNRRGHKTGTANGRYDWLEYTATVEEFAKIGIEAG